MPLYALVNKFDQKDRNSDDEEQVRAMISGTLMKGTISPGQIYPVSLCGRIWQTAPATR